VTGNYDECPANFGGRQAEENMKYRVLTLSREYGSGGAEIADIIARDLGWKLVDKELVAEISRREKISPSEVAVMDERVDPWIYRITRSIWSTGVDGISNVAPMDLFDAEKAASVAKMIIEEAYKIGNCVIVGRGSPCILHDKEDVFHAFIYARWEDRVRRIRQRVKPGTDVEALIRSMDLDRMEYVRIHHKRNRLDPYLYDLMIDPKNQIEKASRIIIAAMKMAPEAASAD
jgi:cytidylate kinase